MPNSPLNMILNTEAMPAQISPLTSPAGRVLVADGDPDARDLVEFILHRENYEVIAVSNGEKALQRTLEQPPGVIVLETVLPGMNGLEVIKQLRARNRFASLPILILSAKSEEPDRVLGFELGADDYLAKPFSPRELVWRIRRLLRAPQVAEAREVEEVDHDCMKSVGLELDVERHQVTANGKHLNLTVTEFRLLTTLVQRRGRVQTRERLLHDVWEYDKMLDTRTVDTHMRRLRKKLGATRRYLETVRGVGYRFSEI